VRSRFKLKQRTARKKFKAKVRDLKTWFHHHLTTPLSEVWTTLNAKLRGHYQYYGINDNWPWLMKFREKAKRLAFGWLNRRSQLRVDEWVGVLHVHRSPWTYQSAQADGSDRDEPRVVLNWCQVLAGSRMR